MTIFIFQAITTMCTPDVSEPALVHYVKLRTRISDAISFSLLYIIVIRGLLFPCIYLQYYFQVIII